VKLLDEVDHVARLRRLALPTERCYVRWIEHYIRFHKTAEGFRHPNTMNADEVERFLTFLGLVPGQPIFLGEPGRALGRRLRAGCILQALQASEQSHVLLLRLHVPRVE
jgi:Phage integrase, N-terminal SAM-like domain